MSIERSHDKPRVTSRRLRDVSRPASADRGTLLPEGRPYKTANRSLIAMARRAASKALGSVAGDQSAAPEGAQLAAEALRLFRAFVRELNTASPTSRAHALTFALQTMAAQRLTLAAAEAGLSSDRGLQLLEQAAKCQGRAERAATAAIALAGLLDRPRKPGSAGDLAKLMADAAKPREGDE